MKKHCFYHLLRPKKFAMYHFRRLAFFPVLAGCVFFSSCQQGAGTNQTPRNEEADNTEIKLPTEGRPAADAPLTFRLELLAENITAPVGFTHAGDGSNRTFILEQPGRIRIMKENKVLEQPFLDLSNRVAEINPSYSEMGLLGLAFHPEYRSNGRFFVYYSAPSRQKGMDHTSVLAEYQVSADNPDRAGMTEKVIMRYDQPESNHNGGQLAFGPDGFLYVGLGDGGGAGDRHGRIGHGLDSTTILGSILRININDGSPYSIPGDNPFVGRGGIDEIFAYGLRNPWRFSFDRETGQLFCADVGQNKFEEVNIIKQGKNYGWRAMEGHEVYDEDLARQKKGFAPPIDVYPREVGISTTGGYVYRGQQFPQLRGHYIFGDWSGKIFYLSQLQEEEWERQAITFQGMDSADIGMKVNSFGEDEMGEIYVCTQQEVGPLSKTGRIYRIVLSSNEQQTGSR
jgi:glucose/arabinose dehydrogenase